MLRTDTEGDGASNIGAHYTIITMRNPQNRVGNYLGSYIKPFLEPSLQNPLKGTLKGIEPCNSLPRCVLSVWPAKGRILNMATPKMTTDSSRQVPKDDLKGIGAENIMNRIAKIRAY